jgi:peptide/nickel transport system substrate-binding protein
MNRIDQAVVGALVVVLAVIALAIGAPGVVPAPTPSPVLPSGPPLVPYREGILGRPVSVSPLGARSQVDRDLVALAFAGLVRLGPDGTFVPDLASRWTVDPTGGIWTFTLRPGARWHDGQPVTADDVVFTVGILRDATYAGPGAGSWREVTATAIDARTVKFQLETPLGGFLQLATQPIAPAHLLGGVPIESLADDPFGQAPIGSGPFVIAELDADHAVLEPAASIVLAPNDPSAPEASAAPPTDALVTPRPTQRPDMPQPILPRLEFRFFDDPAPLATAFRAGDLEAASGLGTADAAELATTNGAHALRYPGTTLTTVLLNLRLGHPELRDTAVRTALLQAIDREALVSAVFGGMATVAGSPIPPTSWAFDPAASPALTYDPAAAAKALEAAGWKKVEDHWRPKATEAYTLELLSPDREMNPVLAAVAERVAADWQAIGLTVSLIEVDPGTLVSDHLQAGKFAAATIDLSIGHDPDLYPLLASSQTRTGGLNLIGLQDATLDALLAAARRPGPEDARKTAYAALQTALTAGRFVLPLAFADEVSVVSDRLSGAVVQPVGDPSDRFWDVLTWRLANDR